jgi:PAS domain S-box-containing protein
MPATGRRLYPDAPPQPPAILPVGAMGALNLDFIRETALRVGRLAEALFGAVEADVVAVQDGRLWRGKARTDLADDDFARWVALTSEDMTWIADTRLDPAWCDHPAVTMADGVRFFAVAPIRLRNGMRLGALRVIDLRPHPYDPQLAARLEDLAEIVAAECDRHAGGQARRIRELFDMAPGFMAFLRGPEHILEMVNEAYTLFVGDRDHDLIGRPAVEALPELADQGFIAILSRVRRTGEPYVGKCVKMLLSRRPGEARQEVYADLLVQPVREADGSISGIFWQGYEVTSEKIAVDELLRSREKLASALSTTQAIFDNSRDIICAVDAHGVFARVSKQSEALFGYRPDELVGHTFRAFIPPEDVEASWRLWARLKDGSPTDLVAGTQMHKDGSRVPVMWSLVWSDEDQTMFATARDMREHLATEAALRQALKMEAVGRLTGGVAHDFNNLLTVIIGGAEALTEQLVDQPSLRPVAQMALEAAEKGAELVSQLLAYSRIQPLAPRPVDCGRLLASLAPIVRRTISEEIEVEAAQAPQDAFRCLADETQLTSAMLNLCINARDAMPDGGRLKIGVSRASSAPPAENGGEPLVGAFIVLSVEDNGAGMTPETLARAMEPFFTTKPVGEGSGLGLSMVYGFVTQSGGSLAIESEVGVGTVIWLYLPETTEPVVEAAALEPAAAPTANHHILLVEDDEMVSAQVERQLRVLGYRVTARSNGVEALEALTRVADIDLLFTDIVMPGGMNGRQLADAARILAPRLRILFTSGYTEDASILAGRLDAASAFLAKPYRRADLARKLALAFEA